MGMHRRAFVSIVAVMMALSASLTVTSGARADNIGGRYTICAQLVSFYAPGPTEGGIVVHGIGPGLYTPEDLVGHHFLFAAGTILDPALSDSLATLADADAFTCLFITSGDYIDTITLVRSADVCGQVALDRDGVWTLRSPDWSYPRQLLGDAATAVAGDDPLAALLARAGAAPSVCLHFEMSEAGRLSRIGLDASIEFCAPLNPGTSPGLGGVDVPAGMLPASAPDALRLLAGRGVEGCASLTVVNTQVVGASIDASDDVCGYVTETVAGEIHIDGSAVPDTLLRADQRDLLSESSAGCLAVEVTGDGVDTTIHETVARTPAPTVAASATASRPAASDEPSESTAAASPVAVPGGTAATSSPDTGFVIAAGLLVALALLLGISVPLARRRRIGPAGATAEGLGAVGSRDQPRATGGPPAPATAQRLTSREREVLQMVVEGLSNRQIGDALYISESTAGVHVSNIMGKLGAANRTEAAALARRLGLLSADGPPGTAGRPN